MHSIYFQDGEVGGNTAYRRSPYSTDKLSSPALHESHDYPRPEWGGGSMVPVFPLLATPTEAYVRNHPKRVKTQNSS